MPTASLARAQRSLGDLTIEYPLYPPLLTGCPRTSDAAVQYPLDIVYDDASVDRALFERPPLPGLARWASLLPPLAEGLSMGEGGTPLVDATPRLRAWAGLDALAIKDESRNPTWSHKDRLNLCAVSAAVAVGAPGVVVSSSGNHGAAAAAYAARAGLPCIVLTSNGVPPAVGAALRSTGAAVVALPSAARWPMMRHVIEALGYHPVSNLTPTHTGHPFGPEGYKTIAWELRLQLGGLPAAVCVPTGYGELLYGVYRGFGALRELGVTDRVPRLIACEPAARAPLALALARGVPAVSVPETATAAYAIGVTVNGYRGVLAVRGSDGEAVAVSEAELAEAQRELARAGLWQEVSGVAGLAAARQLARRGWRPDGPVVCIATSSGFKDAGLGADPVPESAPTWDALRAALRARYGIRA